VANLKVSQSGNYQLSTLRSYKTPDNQILVCKSTPSGVFVFQASTNVITLYPNPTSDLVYLETKETIKNLDVRFYTLLGQQVFKFRLDDTYERKEI
jgi:hypothetical protein